jgi:hypothetical protein
VVLAVEREGFTARCAPHASNDRELFLEHLESIARRRERNRVRRMLRVVPTRAESEFNPTAAHRVCLRDLDCERARKSKRRGCHQRAQSDTRRFATDRGERHPRVSGTWTWVTLADALIVVGAEERVEAELFGELGDREELVVGCPLLGFGEDSGAHGPWPTPAAAKSAHCTGVSATGASARFCGQRVASHGDHDVISDGCG